MILILRKKNGGEELLIDTSMLSTGPCDVEDSNGWPWAVWEVML